MKAKQASQEKINYPELEDRICAMVRERWSDIDDKPAWVTNNNIDILNAITREDVRFLATIDIWYSMQEILRRLP